jgi:hypothetical protein
MSQSKYNDILSRFGILKQRYGDNGTEHGLLGGVIEQLNPLTELPRHKHHDLMLGLFAPSNIMNGSMLDVANYAYSFYTESYLMYPCEEMLTEWVSGLYGIKNALQACNLCFKTPWMEKEYCVYNEHGRWLPGNDTSRKYTIQISGKGDTLAAYGLKFDEATGISATDMYEDGLSYEQTLVTDEWVLPLEGQVMFTEQGKNEYLDYAITTKKLNEFGYRTYDVNEFKIIPHEKYRMEAMHDLVREQLFDLLNVKLPTWTPGAAPGQLWRMLYVARTYSPLHQTVLETQTYLVRFIPAWIRKVYGSTKRQSFDVRDMVAQEYFDSLHDIRYKSKVTATSGNLIGIYWHKRRPELVHLLNVSGHMMDLVMCSMYGNVDINRYVATIEGNLNIASGIDTEIQKVASTGMVAELGASRKLWHTYQDYAIGVLTAYAMVKALELNVPYGYFVHVLTMLNNIKVKKTFRRKWNDVPKMQERNLKVSEGLLLKIRETMNISREVVTPAFG